MWFAKPEDIIRLTPLWKGDRLPDGRPHVPASVLERMREVNMEQAWGTMQKHGYKFQHQTGFQMTQPDKRLVGRAVTATFVPTRPDLHELLFKIGHEEEGRKGNYNQWVIDILIEDDVLVIDLYDKITNGTFVGGNLSTAINARTGRGGLVCWGGIRDMEQIVTIKGIQVFHRGEDPTAIGDCVMPFANCPTRIGQATCLPGDVVLGTISGVIFIPAHLAEEVVITAEKVALRDDFGFETLRDGTYTSAQIDTGWTLLIMEHFMRWIKARPDAAKYAHLSWDGEMEEARKREANDSNVRLM